MRSPSPLRKGARDPSVETTALHMADAIGFLMRVAADAGLGNIEVKLAGVRASLLATERRAIAKSRLAESKAGRRATIAAGDSK
jgi:hypothetical protein